MTAIRTNIQPSSDSPILPGGLASLLSHLINSWVAGIIARCERQAARAALRQLDERELKDIGIYRLGDTLSEIARERNRLQQRGEAG